MQHIVALLIASGDPSSRHRLSPRAVKAGTIDCIYGFPGGSGSVGIANADSVDQLNEMLMNSPLFLYSEYDVRPLTDYAKYLDHVAAALKKREG
jgi:muconolactone delta-isomerase